MASGVFEIIGAVAGFWGGIAGSIALWRGEVLKRQETRLLFRTELSNLKRDLAELLPSIEYANQSRLRVMAASGLNGSGQKLAWEASFAADHNVARELVTQTPSFEDSTKLSIGEMADRLAIVRSLSDTARRLREKYGQTLRDDDRDRERIKDRVKAEVARTLDKQGR